MGESPVMTWLDENYNEEQRATSRNADNCPSHEWKPVDEVVNDDG